MVFHFYKTGELKYESPLKDGRTHGTLYIFDPPDIVGFSEQYSNGLANGTAKQYLDGELIGTYTMKRGTGLDLWRNRRSWGTGSIFLSEARYLKDGMFHGFEWWLNEDQKSVHHERHFWKDQRHGIERVWNNEGRLKRGYPKYWIKDRCVTKRQYARECDEDRTLPAFRESDNSPKKRFPAAVKTQLRMK